MNQVKNQVYKLPDHGYQENLKLTYYLCHFSKVMWLDKKFCPSSIDQRYRILKNTST